MTRGEIQGFIDGYITAGGDPTKMRTDIVEWMANHPLYPQSKQDQDQIISDIESYRGVVESEKAALTPRPMNPNP